eukprot:3379666-Prymnesium_polylepis.1
MPTVACVSSRVLATLNVACGNATAEASLWRMCAAAGTGLRTPQSLVVVRLVEGHRTPDPQRLHFCAIHIAYATCRAV